MRIGLVFGGNTTEGKVSAASAIGIRGALQKLGHTVVDLEFNKNIAMNIMDANVEVVFNSMHGQYGEDGRLQGLLDIMQIPYTHSGCLPSAMAMNKKICKQIFNNMGLKTPYGIVVKKQDLFNDIWKAKVLEDEILRDKKELFIKPVCDGSSRDAFLIHDVNNFNFNSAEITTSSNEFLVEERIIGREIQVAVLGKDPKAIGMVEIKSNKEFYDYDAKYTENASKHIQVETTEEIRQNLLQSALNIHKVLNLKDISRSEFFLTSNNDIIVLEINSHPGFTATSIVPEIAKNIGISYEDIVDMLIKNATFNK